MRMRRLTGSSSPGAEAVNVTPLIDVVMCLIIFFLIVGKLATDRGLPVNLPRTGVGQEEQSASLLVVTVVKLGADEPKTGWGAYGIRVQADGRTLDFPKDLETAVRGKLAGNPSASVQVRADRELPYGAIEPVLRALGLGGAKSVRLATERTS
ncbi:MAG: biopolymer transporter ExbD [Phycisphaerales bacterium]|nr:biopolymer transporter ExbD [Phycisphaerales bacterium]